MTTPLAEDLRQMILATDHESSKWSMVEFARSGIYECGTAESTRPSFNVSQ